MAIVTSALLKGLNTGFAQDFKNGLKDAPAQYEEIATIIKSTSDSNTYGFLGKFPKLKEMIGTRTIESMASHGYQLKNKTFGETVGIARTEIEDDNLSIYSTIMQEMGQSAKLLPEELVFSLLSKGAESECYDGQNFFDTEHPVYPKVDGSGAPILVSNIIEGSNKPWYLLDCSGMLKPFIYQDRLSPELVVKNKMDDDHVFMEDEYLYGVRMRGNAGYGLWQQALMSKAELTKDNVWAAIAQMRAIRGDGDKRLGIRPTHLIVPPEHEQTATVILNMTYVSATENELKGRLKLITSDYLD